MAGRPPPRRARPPRRRPRGEGGDDERAPAEDAAADRTLDHVERQRREREGRPDAHDVEGHAVEPGARSVERDLDRPVPQVQAVRDARRSNGAGGRESSRRSGERPGRRPRRSAPPRRPRTARTRRGTSPRWCRGPARTRRRRRPRRRRRRPGAQRPVPPGASGRLATLGVGATVARVDATRSRAARRSAARGRACPCRSRPATGRPGRRGWPSATIEPTAPAMQNGAEQAGPAAGEAQAGERDERPDQVELLLDRERPGVAQRRGGGEDVEVGLAAGRRTASSPRRTGSRARRPGGCPAGPVGARGPAQTVTAPSTSRSAGSSRRARRAQNARRSMRRGPAELDEQQRRDEVAGEDEEGVDAEEAAPRPAGNPRWYAMTARTATARSPSSAGWCGNAGRAEPAPSTVSTSGARRRSLTPGALPCHPPPARAGQAIPRLTVRAVIFARRSCRAVACAAVVTSEVRVFLAFLP